MREDCSLTQFVTPARGRGSCGCEKQRGEKKKKKTERADLFTC